MVSWLRESRSLLTTLSSYSTTWFGSTAAFDLRHFQLSHSGQHSSYIVSSFLPPTFLIISTHKWCQLPFICSRVLLIFEFCIRHLIKVFSNPIWKLCMGIAGHQLCLDDFDCYVNRNESNQLKI